MKRRPCNRVVIGLMLLAALATYANAPRLAGTLLIGNAVNYVAVASGQSRAALEARLAASPQDAALAERLDEGTRSLAIVESLPALPGVVASHEVQPRIEAVSVPPRIENPEHLAFTLLPGRLIAAMALPPPLSAAEDSLPLPPERCRSGLAARGPPRLA